MALTPALISLTHRSAPWLSKFPFPQRLKTGLRYSGSEHREHEWREHLIIVGFGLRGRHLARVAKEKGIAYLILEMNPDTVKNEKKMGEPIRYGDPSHPSVLLHAGIKHAQQIVVVINDPAASIRIIKMAKELNPAVHVVGRVRYFQEVKGVLSAGADEVITDELGSSLEILTRVMQKCQVPQEQIAQCVQQLRLEGDQVSTRTSPSTAMSLAPEV